MDVLTAEQSRECRDEAIGAVMKRAGQAFMERAEAYILDYLRAHGATAGEQLTRACLSAGIEPHDDRAFGPVYMRLSRRGAIEKCGLVPRARGHMTSGGNVWRLKIGGIA